MIASSATVAQSHAPPGIQGGENHVEENSRRSSDRVGAVDVRRAYGERADLHPMLDEDLARPHLRPGSADLFGRRDRRECYCGVWTGVSPQQAVDQGWYASCNNGNGICNFAPGTRASNQVCGPF